jgi:hypothetical protein
VQGGRGVNGTATLVRSLSSSGAQLTNVTTPLAGDPPAALLVAAWAVSACIQLNEDIL